MSFENAKNVNTQGTSFSVVKAGMQVIDNSGPTTKVNSFKADNNIISGSYNDDTQRYDGATSNLPSPPPGRDRSRSANNDYARAPLYPPPSSVHPGYMNAAYAEPGSRIQDYDAFNTKNRKVDNAYYNNSPEYGCLPSRRVKKPKKRPPSLSEGGANDAQMPDGDEAKEDHRSPPSGTCLPYGMWKTSQPTFGGGGDPIYHGDPRTRGIPPDPLQFGSSYPYHPPVPQPMYQYTPYGYAPPVPPYLCYANYGGYPQPQIPGVRQMGENRGWVSADVMNQAKREMEKDANRIRENKASVQDADTSGDEECGDTESESETDSTPKHDNVKRVPKAVKDGPSRDMEKMRLDDEFRPDFFRAMSDPRKQFRTQPANNGPIQQGKEAQNSGSSPDVSAPQKNQAFMNFGGSPLRYGTGSQGVPVAPDFPSPFYSNIPSTGFSFGTHSDRYTHIDNSVHTHNFDSGNTTNNITQDSYNDNQIKGARGRRRERGYRKQVVIHGGSGHRVAGRDYYENSNK